MSTLNVNNINEAGGVDAVITSGVLDSGSLPAGSVLQVVSTTKTDTFSTTSTSLTDVTGLSASITPSSVSNKILVSISVMAGHGSVSDFAMLTVTDGSDNILINADTPGSRIPSFALELMRTTEDVRPETFVLLHEPATTSSFTYKVRIKTSANTVYVNRSGTDGNASDRARGVSTITLMEIAG